jgi:hypothetical protein
MPWKYTDPQGRFVIDGIPDSLNEKSPEVQAEIAKRVKTAPASAPQTPGVPTPAELGAAQGGITPKEAGAPPGGLGPLRVQDMVQSIPSNLGAAGRGVVSGIASPVTMVADPLTAVVNPILKMMGVQQQLPPGQALQVILDKLGVPNAETRSQEIMQAATSGMASGASNVIAGNALKSAPGAVGAVGESLAAQPAAQLTGGATGAATSESARQMGAPPGVQLAAGLVGGAVGGIAGNTEAVPRPMGPVDEAKGLNTWLMTSDVHPPTTPFGKILQTVRESLGTGSVRNKQQQARIQDVRDLVQTYGAQDLGENSNAVMQDLLSKHKTDLNKWVTAKNEVLDKLSNPDASGTEFGRTASERIKDLTTLEMNHVITPKLQDELNQLRSAPGTSVVPMPSTNQKIDEGIAYLTSLSPKLYSQEIKALQDWKEAIQGQNLANIETLRKDIGEVFSAINPDKTSSVPTTGEKVLASIYGSKDKNGLPVDGVLKDMTDFIKTNGGQADMNKWLVANKNLHDMMNQLGLTAIRTAIDKGEMTPETINKVLFSKDKSTVEALYKNLTPDGQAAARSAVISRAALGDNGIEATPDQFLTNVKKMSKQIGVFFSGDDLKSLEGLTRVLSYTARAGETKSTGNIGVKAAIMMPVSIQGLASIFGKGMPGLLGLSGAAAGVSGLSLLYESKLVRAILSALPKLKPGSKEEEAALKSLLAVSQNTISKATPKTTETQKPDQFGSTNYPGAPGMGANASQPRPPVFPTTSMGPGMIPGAPLEGQ